MANPAPPSDNRTSVQPLRTYEIPGGPVAKDLGSVDVKVLAEIVRGGEGDAGFVGSGTRR